MFPTERCVGVGACCRASGIVARCVFENAAVSSFQTVLAYISAKAKGPLRGVARCVDTGVFEKIPRGRLLTLHRRKCQMRS